MKIVVGLGNLGKKFEKNRHNVGFLTVDYIQKNAGDFTKWQLKKKLKSEIAESKELDVILAKPQTFMNNSGEAIRNLISSFKFQVYMLFTTISTCRSAPLNSNSAAAQPATREYNQLSTSSARKIFGD